MEPRSEQRNPQPQPERPTEAVRRYDRLKYEIAKIAQAVMPLCQRTKDEEGQRLYQSLLARLAEDRFNLAVVGSFNRGKSTLMNALLGMDRLPTGVLPHTSVITAVTYGSRERVLIRCAGWSLAQEVPLGRLAEYVTEQGNPGNQRQVTVAEIQLPAQILRHGLQFVDTPGINSGIAANTAAAEGYIPEIDAAIFVTSAESPLEEAELGLLRRLYDEVGQVFVVINKLDLLSEHDRTRVTAFARARLDAEFGEGRLGMFALSAQRALAAKLTSNLAGLATTGLPALEQALSEFLATSKIRQFYTRVLDRLERLLKWQQLDTTIAIALGERQDLGEALRHQFNDEVTELLTRVGTLTTTLHTRLAEGVAKLLRVVLDNFCDDAHSRIAKAVAPRLIARSVIIKRSEALEVLAWARAFFEQVVNEWISAARPITIQPAIERIGAEKLRELKTLPEGIARIAARLSAMEDVSRPEPPGNDELELMLPRLPCRALAHPPPIWLALLPARWFRPAVSRWFDAALTAALDRCRAEIVTAVRLAADEYVDRIRDRVRREIAQQASRITTSIGSREREQEAAVIEESLRRVAMLRMDIEAGPMLAERAPADFHTNGHGRLDSQLGEQTCPVCTYVAEVLFAFLSKRQYELSASERAQNLHVEVGGFCSLHTWMYSEMTSPHGICTAYPPLLSALSAKLNSRLAAGVQLDELAITVQRILQRGDHCPACKVVASAEKERIAGLISHWAGIARDSEVPPAFCLTHLYHALEAGPEPEVARALCAWTAAALERSADNMRRYALKHDALRRNLMTHEERIAYLLALARVAGDKRLMPRWVNDEL